MGRSPLDYYVEVIFVGPQRARGTQIFNICAHDMRVIKSNLMELEDGEASAEVRALFAGIISRETEALTPSDREAERARGHLVTLESR